MVCWVSFYRRNLDILFTSHPFPRRVDLVMVPLVEFRRLRFLVLSFGGRGSSDKCGLGAEVEVTRWRAMSSSGNSRSLAFFIVLKFASILVICSCVDVNCIRI